MRILIIDDDAALRDLLARILRGAGHDVEMAENGAEGLELAAASSPEVIFCDLRMPVLGGLEFLDRYGRSEGSALVIVITAFGSTELAVDAMKRGAYDYLPKPFGAHDVLLTLEKAAERDQLRREVGRLREEVRADRRFGQMVARSPAMVKALELATKVARHDSPVLIQGASGTGKELVARLIHDASPRRDRPFVAVNCGAIPPNLLESEFFGHVRGAFSGATRDREGLFGSADGGTLLLDEIGDLPQPLQVKLLRVLQSGEFRPVGSDETTAVDVRVLAATNRELAEEMAEGRFREDLYYRLAVVSVELPALAERREEIPALAHHFVDRLSSRLGISVEGIEAQAVNRLVDYSWPGNVRELENVLERAVVVCESGTIRAADLPEHVGPAVVAETPEPPATLNLNERKLELERRLIREALETADSRTAAAEMLGISPRALRYKVREHGLA